MALRNVPYAAQTAPTMIELDQTFQDVSALGVIPSTASGTNTITLTPTANTPTISAYANYQAFGFIATATSNGAVTIGFQALAALKAYKDTAAGPIQLQSGDVINVNYYLAVYDLALNSGAGGFHVIAGASGAQQQTRTVLTSGSGTYTTPLGVTRILVRLIGAGGGGAGSGVGAGNGGNGGNTTFGASLTGSGGGGAVANGVVGTGGGAASGGDVNIAGGTGASAGGSATDDSGGNGGSGFFGGAGLGPAPNQNGTNGATNSGAGGGGAGSAASQQAGGGGGSGGYVEKLIVAPVATYAYAVGAAGTAGAAGNGGSGGTGGSGIIIIDEFYG